MMWLLVMLAMCGLALADVPENRQMRNSDLFQGDILLTPEQKIAIESGGDHTRVGRAAFRGNLWPNGVMSYTIDYSLQNNARAMASIRAGMKSWSDSTCITFQPRTNERNYVRFFQDATQWLALLAEGRTYRWPVVAGIRVPLRTRLRTHSASITNNLALTEIITYRSSGPTSQVNSVHLDIEESSSDDLLNTCRICRDETVRESLISPCHCSGTLGKCHIQCLEAWLSRANKTSCEICGHKYHTARIPRSFKEWFSKGQSRRERRYLLGDLVCFLILSPLVIASSYLCAKGAWYYYVIADQWTGTGLVSLSLFLWCVFGFWLVVTVRYHQRCWVDWRSRNQVVKLVKMERFEEGELDDQGRFSRMETEV